MQLEKVKGRKDWDFTSLSGKETVGEKEHRDIFACKSDFRSTINNLGIKHEIRTRASYHFSYLYIFCCSFIFFLVQFFYTAEFKCDFCLGKLRIVCVCNFICICTF